MLQRRHRDTLFRLSYGIEGNSSDTSSKLDSSRFRCFFAACWQSPSCHLSRIVKDTRVSSLKLRVFVWFLPESINSRSVDGYRRVKIKLVIEFNHKHAQYVTKLSAFSNRWNIVTYIHYIHYFHSQSINLSKYLYDIFIIIFY